MLKKTLPLAAYLLLALFCTLYGLGIFNVGNHYYREGWLDSNGNAFTGYYLPSEDKWEGTVYIEFTDGATYEGELAGGRFNGDGVYTSASGAVLKGTFVNGRLQ